MALLMLVFPSKGFNLCENDYVYSLVKSPFVCSGVNRNTKCQNKLISMNMKTEYLQKNCNKNTQIKNSKLEP